MVTEVEYLAVADGDAEAAAEMVRKELEDPFGPPQSYALESPPSAGDSRR
ncbi:hypothetical protein ABT063_47050 [Streptomyces sp. NPDC002838]